MERWHHRVSNNRSITLSGFIDIISVGYEINQPLSLIALFRLKCICVWLILCNYIYIYMVFKILLWGTPYKNNLLYS